ncbi:tRNA (cytidine/uridine-2'-O-)-methyltransferase TrmJ, partial [Vibrio harveyi]
MIISLGF